MASQSVRLGDLAPHLSGLAEEAFAGLPWPEIFAKIVVILQTATIENFESQKSPDGVAWKPTFLRRERQGARAPDASRGEARQTLRDTGRLYGSLSGRTGDTVQVTSGTLLEWGTNVEYGPIHQYGGTVSVPEQRRAKPWVFVGRDGNLVFTRKLKARTFRIPARPFLGINDQVLTDIRELLADELGEAFGK